MKLINKAIYICMIMISVNLFAQQNPFKEISPDRITNKEKFTRAHYPTKYHLYGMDVQNVFNIIKNTPALSSNPSSITMKLPNTQGEFDTFWIYDNSAMEKELAETVTNIRSLKAVNIKNPAHTVSISISDIFGFHAMGVMLDGSVYYIDNYTNDLSTVIVYNRSDLESSKTNFNCLVTNDSFNISETNSLPIQAFSMDNKRRTFRLALACTTEYAQFHINNAPAGTPSTTEDQKKNIVLAAMNVSLTRLNQIFEKEINVHLNLIANNKNIIFVTTDNFNNNDAGVLLQQSQNVITSVIGTSNFDMGHTFSTGGGGVASLGSVCVSSRKAAGITGSDQPVGDPYDVDYVAHEMGHQFGANHTYNNSCFGNQNAQTAMETGSGSTIMSYAGICPPNVQNNVDPYYHYISIREMQTFLATASCAQQTTVNNNPPSVSPLQAKTIPYGTPFILTATASDTDGDQLTYAFEQTNNQITSQPPLGNASGGPAFRSVNPSIKNYRSFPSEATVLAGTTNTNGVADSNWERLALRARSYSFVVVVRDNNAIGARVVYTQPVIITAANTGPFVITYPNNNPTTNEPLWHTGSTKTITWNVAGTTANNINTASVNILVSTDDGVTYTAIANNVPNNGSAIVTIPTTLANTYQGRIKIEAVGNIFYTVSKKLTIWDPTASNEEFQLNDFKIYPNPAKDILTIEFSTKENNATTFDIFDLNGRLIKSETQDKSNNIQHKITIDQLSSGTYLLKITNGKNSSTHKFIKE